MKPRSSMNRTVVVLFASVFAGAVTLAQTNPVPLINQPLVPDAVAPGAQGFTLTVNGTGFVSGSEVSWNGNARATAFVSSSQLTATIPATDLAKASTASVTVFNPSPGGGTSNQAYFEVITPRSAISLNRSDYGVGAGPLPVATGDFNGDGTPDLAVGNTTSNTVSVLLGNGDGTFQAHVDYSEGLQPWYVAVGDFNGDGKLDLAVANILSNTVGVLLGNGDGTFSPSVSSEVGSFPTGVAVGDFNGDGKLDLAITNSRDNSVSVLLGKGDGTFQGRVDYACGPDPSSIAVGDFNEDGRLDLVTTNATGNTVSVLLGNGDGTFQPHQDYATGDSPESVAVGDLNGDAKLDLAVANINSGTVSVLLGNGDGTFQTHIDYSTGTGQIYPRSVALTDLNGDGNLDMAVVNQANNTVSVLFGNGDGTFHAHVDYGVGTAPGSVAAGDFNNDGESDLAVVNVSNDTVSVLLQGTTFQLSSTSLSFGSQVLGTQSPVQKVTLTNTGFLPLIINSIAITGPDGKDFLEQNNCGSSLAAGASCTIGVAFAPTQVGPRSAAVAISDNGEGPQSVSLSGTGVTSGANATLSTNKLVFATQLVGTTSPSQPVTLTNWGTQTLRITGGSISGDFGQMDNCSANLAPGASCTINVTFTPKQRGTRNGTLSIKDNAPNSPQTVNLTGVGTVVKLDPGSLDFASVIVGQSSQPQATTLTNVGNVTLTITGIEITGSDPNDFSKMDTCDGSVGAGQSCTISVTFTPTQQGPRSADVSVGDDGGGSPQQVSLTGTGIVCSRGHNCGLCEVDMNGNLTGSCVSHRFQFCYIQPSSDCPRGQRAIKETLVSCGPFLPDRVDEARACSF
jgi:hypothetical protein